MQFFTRSQRPVRKNHTVMPSTNSSGGTVPNRVWPLTELSSFATGSFSNSSPMPFVQWVWLPGMTAGEFSRETDIAGRLEWLTVYSTSSTRLEMPSFSKM